MTDSTPDLDKVRTTAMTSSTTLHRMRIVALAAVGGAVLASCASDAPQDTWQPAGSEAQKIHDLQWPIFMIAGIVGVIVMVAVAYCVVKFRDRGQPIPEQSQSRHSFSSGMRRSLPPRLLKAPKPIYRAPI